ncbi:LicD family protein [Kordiimonas sp. SCSIO 12603]|uniref:LicD family protein n=1 Tax=Kordiimonas sp. SCSIO 12603 TaxID=2829596 RepID=UPI0021051F0B|nr:LicD family protein [Kordiimonas sp. SCSIO 12603]UTW60017.1 LicD family protein [Kordiimonas sp. SCSIO 12603]
MSNFKSGQLDRLKKNFQQLSEGMNLTELGKFLPGHKWSPSTALKALHISVPKGIKKIRIESDSGASSSLCFSQLSFIGLEKGKVMLTDLSEYVTASQSSHYRDAGNAEAATSGALFSNNIHTKAEVGAFWQADLPDTVELQDIYLQKRGGVEGINHSKLKVFGTRSTGEDVLLYRNFEGEFRSAQLQELIASTIEAAEQLGKFVPDRKKETYDLLLELIAADIAEAAALRKKEVFEPNQLWRTSLARKLLKLVDAALVPGQDFGTKPESGYVAKFAKQKARFLRIRVYGALATSLGGIQLLNSNVPDADMPVFSGKTTKFMYHISSAFAPDYYQLGFRGKACSRIIEFESEEEFDGLRVWNVNQMQCANTLFIDFEISDDRKTWTCIHRKGREYKYLNDILDLVGALCPSPMLPEHGYVLGKMFTIYRRRNMIKPLSALTRNSGNLEEKVFEGSNSVFDQQKYASPLRLGKHGLMVPIGYRDEKETMQQLCRVRDDIEALGYKPMLMYGTLLGAVREKDFIPHDDDLDLAIIVEDVHPDKLIEEADKVYDAMKAAGIKTSRGPAHAPLFHCQRPPLTIDIFILAQFEGKIYWPHKALAIVPEDANIFLPAGQIEFKGELFSAPADVEAVLEARYGADWRIPNAAFEWTGQ